ncbi:MAG TPA: hypothetical protein VMW52_07515, partial [Phycisphaerae bacterium]|nr:hypothetical protein [Phycisphaerae bacterium]
HRVYQRVCKKLYAARRARDEALEQLVAWKLCPACCLPVPTSGIVCKTGACLCGALVLESDGAAPCDPAAMVAELRAELAVLAEQLAASRGAAESRSVTTDSPQSPVAPDVAIGRQADKLQRMCDEMGLACEISVRSR